MTAGFFMAVAALLATWVLVDARQWGVRRGLVAGFFDMGPVGWAASVLLLWVVVFPLYLRRRSALRTLVEQVDGPRSVEPGRGRWLPRSRLWVMYSVAMFGTALLVSWNPPYLGGAPYCLVWDPSGGGWGSFGLWPFGPTCTFLYQHPVRTFEPGAIWSASFFYWMGSGLLLLAEAIRSSATSGFADRPGLADYTGQASRPARRYRSRSTP